MSRRPPRVNIFPGEPPEAELGLVGFWRQLWVLGPPSEALSASAERPVRWAAAGVS